MVFYHMTKMNESGLLSHDQNGRHAIYVKKTLQIFFSRTRSPMILKHCKLKLYKVYIKDDPGLTYILRHDLWSPMPFQWGKAVAQGLNRKKKLAAIDTIDRGFMFLKTKLTLGDSLPLPEAIYMYSTTIFKYIFKYNFLL